MDPALSIDRLALRYRIPAALLDRRGELEAIREQVFGHALEAALDAEGLLGHEQLCIRRLHLPLRVELDAGRRVVVEAWTAAIVAAIREQLRLGDPRQVIRYRSPRAALVDFARGVARGDRRRAWAWRELGLVDARALEAPLREGATDALSEALERALLRRPEAIVAVLAELAHSPEQLRRLSAKLSSAGLSRLAAAALRAQGLADAAIARLVDSSTPKLAATVHSTETGAEREPAIAALVDSPAPEREPARAGKALLALLRRSVMLVALRAELAAKVAGSAEQQRELRAWSIFAALAEAPLQAPAWLARASVDLPALVAAALGLPTPAHGPAPRPADARAEPAASPRESDGSPPGRAVSPGEAPPTTKAEATAGEAPKLEPWRELPEAPSVARTRWGGLLLLVPLMRALDGWTRLAQLAVRETETGELRPVAHEFAKRLIPEPVAADDPGLLAFVGLGPEADAPVLDGALTRALDAGLDALRAELLDALVACLPADAGPPGPADERPERLLRWLVERRAEIVADPGWLELRFDLREVDTDIRRAGLDLDPDWLPALGVVVKFIYV